MCYYVVCLYLPDEWENLPLVAVSTTDVQAVQHDLFVQLLAGLGMTPPEVDQVSSHIVVSV